MTATPRQEAPVEALLDAFSRWAPTADLKDVMEAGFAFGAGFAAGEDQAQARIHELEGALQAIYEADEPVEDSPAWTSQHVIKWMQVRAGLALGRSVASASQGSAQEEA